MMVTVETGAVELTSWGEFKREEQGDCLLSTCLT